MKDQNRHSWETSTKLNHPKDVPLTPGNKPLIAPVYLSAKYTPSESEPYWDQFIYSRISNPTTRQLEESLAEIQNKEDCLVFSSGIGALSLTFLSLLKEGDHMISFRELYKPARNFIKSVLPEYGIEYTLLSVNALEELEKAIKPNTRLIHFESPTNPNLELTDIEAILKIAHKNNILVSMDGTFGGPHQHTEFNLDLMIHSLTKFANGHGDVIAGSVAGSRKLMAKIRERCMYFGASLDPQAAYLIQRGLKTYKLRYEHQSRSSLEVARFLSSHPMVKWVRHPGLTEHPLSHQMKDHGSVIAFELDQKLKLTADEFCHRLGFIQLAASLGSTETIICPSDIFFGQDLSAQEKAEMKINSFTLRLSIGLEDPRDIISDLSLALGK